MIVKKIEEVKSSLYDRCTTHIEVNGVERGFYRVILIVETDGRFIKVLMIKLQRYH